METLVIYFSQKGKTKEAARRIAQLSGADLAEIKTLVWNISKCSIQFSGQGKSEWKKSSNFYNQRSYRTTEDCGEDQKEIFCKMVQTI